MLTRRRRYHPPYDRSGADAGFARARRGGRRAQPRPGPGRLRPPELALAAEDAGRAMGRLGRLDRARGLLDQAAVIYERLEAAVLSRRTVQTHVAHIFMKLGI